MRPLKEKEGTSPSGPARGGLLLRARQPGRARPLPLPDMAAGRLPPSRSRFRRTSLVQSALDNCLGARAGGTASQWGRAAWSRPSGL